MRAARAWSLLLAPSQAWLTPARSLSDEIVRWNALVGSV